MSSPENEQTVVDQNPLKEGDLLVEGLDENTIRFIYCYGCDDVIYQIEKENRITSRLAVNTMVDHYLAHSDGYHVSDLIDVRTGKVIFAVPERTDIKSYLPNIIHFLTIAKPC